MKVIDFNRHLDYGLEVPPCSRRDLIELAHSVHVKLGYTGDGPFPILSLVERVFPMLYDNYSFEVAEEQWMPDDLGRTWPDEHRIVIREDAYEAAYLGHGFGRMIVAHEASHLLKHEGAPLVMAARKASAEIPAYCSSEWQAKALSGALMMPSCKIITMTVDEIVRRYKVSQTAAELQLRAVRGEAKRWSMPKL